MHLLVAIDGSEEADTALAYAAELVDALDGSLTLVHAVEPDVHDTGGSRPVGSLSEADNRLIKESVEDAETRGAEILEAAAAVADDYGVAVETDLLYGDPVAEMTDYAAEEAVDGIVVGHRGRSERTELMLGSVAKDVVERATIPVTVVR